MRMEASQMGRWTFKSAIAQVSDPISLIFERETKLDLMWVRYLQTLGQKKIKSVNNRRREMTHPDDFLAIFFSFRCNFRLSGQFSLKFSHKVLQYLY